MFVRSGIDRLPPVRNEILGLAERGHLVVVFADCSDEIHACFQKHPVELWDGHLWTAKLPSGSVFGILRFLEFLLRAVWFGLRSRRCDIYVGHDLPNLPPAWIVGRLRKGRVVFNAHELWADKGGRKLVRLARALEQFSLRHVDALIVPSHFRWQVLVGTHGEDIARSTVVMNCPAYHKPLPNGELDHLRSRSDQKIILYQGYLSPARCLDELIDSVQYLDQDAIMVLIGFPASDEYWRYLNEKIQRLDDGSKVYLLPPASYQRLPTIIASADVGVALYAPVSRNNYYCAPNKVFEYMMQGVPIVASDLPSLRQLVKETDTGALVASHHPKDIAGAINALLADEQGRRRMRRNALRLARTQFNWETQMQKLLDLYIELAS